MLTKPITGRGSAADFHERLLECGGVMWKIQQLRHASALISMSPSAMVRSTKSARLRRMCAGRRSIGSALLCGEIQARGTPVQSTSFVPMGIRSTTVKAERVSRGLVGQAAERREEDPLRDNN